MTDAAPAPEHAGFDAPLRIDWLEAAELGSAGGRLGLTFLPGKRGASVRYPGHVYRRDTATDLAAMRRMGVVRLILLVEDGELVRWGDPGLVARARAVGLDVRRHPIADGTAPRSAAIMDAILADVTDARARGDVAVACMGGVGRSGMVAACALVRAGLAPAAAIRRVRDVRHPTAVETRQQEEFVAAYADRAATSA
ncbi:MAG: protein-tyrosine-phosphatase [Candidatus Limnocylindria bacterium]